MSAPTPMMRQYLEIKADYPDAILFFRLGDFYEMFLEDAVIAARVLDITLTSRNKGASDEIPLCGIPYHSYQPYLAKLVANGYKVAVCEQMEDPRSAKGIVKREVVRVVTPGLVVDTETLTPNENNFLLAVAAGEEQRFGVAILDITTGEFRATELADLDGLRSEIASVNPRELLLVEGPEGERQRQWLATSVNGKSCTALPEWVFDSAYGSAKLCEYFACATLDGFGCTDLPAATTAAGAIIHYLGTTQRERLAHLRPLSVYRSADYMVLDDATRRNLELTATVQDGSRRGSLLGVLDRSVTAMGGRLMRRWLGHPLVDVGRIVRRQQAVAELMQQSLLRNDLREALRGVYDLERLNGKLAMAGANARDLAALRLSLERLPQLFDLLTGATAPFLTTLQQEIDLLEDVRSLLAEAVVDEPPFSVREGNLIRDGYAPELDELRFISREGKDWIAQLEQTEKERTGIASLKVRFNRVFGYYIEITRSHLGRVPDDYQRKQTLANAERYSTPQLQAYEEKVLGAEERLVELEFDLFQQLRRTLATHGRRIQTTAAALATLDVIAALAEVAHERNYVVPEIDDSGQLIISEGRHPVVETMSLSERFVANDVILDLEENQILVITGPNMAGKSTFMRQVALITLMAHVGSLVPAAAARIGLVDRIFTRVGASDNLARGQSTFMVEMTETANILNNATSRSLLVIDEIGRGTSTFDGISIAWAVAEYLHDQGRVAAKTLFATHYHELTDLALTRPRVKNFNIAVKEWNEQIIFLRKIVSGPASHSYGIQVARLAGLPVPVIERAREVLRNLESGEFEGEGAPRLARSRRGAGTPPSAQLGLFASGDDRLRQALEQCDPTRMTPLEALNMLDHLKALV